MFARVLTDEQECKRLQMFGLTEKGGQGNPQFWDKPSSRKTISQSMKTLLTTLNSTPQKLDPPKFDTGPQNYGQINIEMLKQFASSTKEASDHA